MAVFKINNIDYSDHVLADGSYQVNEADVYESWNDANGIEHRAVLRQKIVGTFNMYFEDMNDYIQFLADYRASKDINTHASNIKISVNNPNIAEKEIEAFISFMPTRFKDWSWNEQINQFSVNIQER